MNYDKEKKICTSFCGSYCHTCDWFPGGIRRIFQSALDAVEFYGFRRLLEGRIDVENLKEIKEKGFEAGVEKKWREHIS